MEALLLLLLAWGIGSKKSTPNQQQQDPKPVPQGGGGGGFQVDFKTLGSLAGTAVTGIGALLGGIGGGGGAATAAVATATTETVIAGVTESIIPSFGGAALGIFAIVAVLIIFVNVTTGVWNAVHAYHTQVNMLLGYDIRTGSPERIAGVYWLDTQARARSFLLDGLRTVGERLKLPNLYGTFDQRRLALIENIPTRDLQKLVGLALYLGIERSWARNQALSNFFSHLGESAASILSTGSALPGDAFANYYINRALFEARGGNSGIEAISGMSLCLVPTWTYAELEAIARELLGSDFNSYVALWRFQGSVVGIVTASIAGYTNGWPGDEEFAHGIALRTCPEWGVEQSTLPFPGIADPVTGAHADVLINAWWMRDPVTGLAVAPIKSREQVGFVVSGVAQ